MDDGDLTQRKLTPAGVWLRFNHLWDGEGDCIQVATKTVAEGLKKRGVGSISLPHPSGLRSCGTVVKVSSPEQRGERRDQP